MNDDTRASSDPAPNPFSEQHVLQESPLSPLSPSVPASSSQHWQQGTCIELDIQDLSNRGDGVGRWGDRVVFVPDAVPGDRLLVRLIHTKPSYGHGKIQQILTPSPHRVRPVCIVADKCGGCQWQSVDYDQQLLAKHNEVVQALTRIGDLSDPPVDDVLAAEPFGYRNKATYPLGRSPSTGQVQAGYYQKGSHKLVNLNQCPVQDERLNPLLAEVKQDIQTRGWSIYNEQRHQGRLRHLSLRIGQRTGEMLLTLVASEAEWEGLTEQANEWLERYPALVGVLLNLNSQKTNAIFGAETRCVAGQPFITEQFANLTFQIGATTFFQVNTEQAERLLQVILDELKLTGREVLMDAYCGVGTLTLPLAEHVREAIAIESHEPSVEQAQMNASINGINTIMFHVGSVEEVLPILLEEGLNSVDVVVLDPPRKGCTSKVLEALLVMQAPRIVYVSCNPATLARDLNMLCRDGVYQLTRVQPVDLFPQTAHVECVAFLERP
ncbi:MAG: 23S rRNA (uracil(1939)-C(5))-methyltransferase RlmD [Leptolyngbyaceae bacterium]|nr:23S rRNA (uracil(1939)-C(5))-methyltransferase RlmD [Leptolyngbyaceae bacterium]